MVGLRNVLVETQKKMDFFGSGSFVFLAKLPEMLKEFGYFGGGFFCWEDVFLGKTTMFNAVRWETTWSYCRLISYLRSHISVSATPPSPLVSYYPL